MSRSATILRAEQSRAEQSRAEHHSAQRNLSIDFIRGIAIIFVVLGHSIQFGSGTAFYDSEGYYSDFLFKFIYSFHMPLFALLSGYLFYWSMARRSSGKLIKRQVLSLLVPIVVWKGLEFVARGALQIIQGEFSLLDFTTSYISGLLHSFWFLWAIFLSSLALIVVEILFKGNMLIYLVLLVAMLFVPTHLNSHLYIYMYPYFVTGYLLHKISENSGRKLDDIVSSRKGVITLSSAVIFAFLFIFFDHDSYIYTTHISLLEADNAIAQLGIDMYRWLIGFAGSVLVIMLCKMVYEKIMNSKVARCVVALGQISLGIYILNSYTNTYVLLKIASLATPNLLLWLVEVVASIAIYILCVWTIKRFQLLNRLLFGGRIY